MANGAGDRIRVISVGNNYRTFNLFYLHVLICILAMRQRHSERGSRGPTKHSSGRVLCFLRSAMTILCNLFCRGKNAKTFYFRLFKFMSHKNVASKKSDGSSTLALMVWSASKSEARERRMIFVYNFRYNILYSLHARLCMSQETKSFCLFLFLFLFV